MRKRQKTSVIVGKEIEVFANAEKKSLTTNLTAATSLSKVTYGKRARLIKGYLRSKRKKPTAIVVPVAESVEETHEAVPYENLTVKKLEVICKQQFKQLYLRYFNRNNRKVAST